MADPDARTLVSLGLSGYEAAAYLALTRRGQAAGAEVARLAGLPRQRIYDVLDSLVGRGFATVQPGRPALYAPAEPAAALRRLVDERRAGLEALEREAADAVARLTPAYEAGRGAGEPLEFVEVLREPAAIARRFAELETAAEREILVFTKPPYAVEPEANVEGLRLLERKIEARSVYERSIYDHPAQVAAIERFVAAGEQARVVDRLPLKLVVIDERVALFTLEDPALAIMVVRHSSLARLLKVAFEAVWAQAEAFAPAGAQRTPAGGRRT